MGNPGRLRHIFSIPNYILTYMYDMRFNQAVLATLHMEMPVNDATMCFEWAEHDPDFESEAHRSIHEYLGEATSCLK